jgi:hypothetical protein
MVLGYNYVAQLNNSKPMWRFIIFRMMIVFVTVNFYQSKSYVNQYQTNYMDAQI